MTQPTLCWTCRGWKLPPTTKPKHDRYVRCGCKTAGEA